MNQQLKIDIDKLYEKTNSLVYAMIQNQLEKDYIGRPHIPALSLSMRTDIHYYLSNLPQVSPYTMVNLLKIS